MLPRARETDSWQNTAVETTPALSQTQAPEMAMMLRVVRVVDVCSLKGRSARHWNSLPPSNTRHEIKCPPSPPQEETTITPRPIQHGRSSMCDRCARRKCVRWSCHSNPKNCPTLFDLLSSNTYPNVAWLCVCLSGPRMTCVVSSYPLSVCS